MKIVLISFVILISYFPIVAQNQGNNWYFGHNAGMTFNSGTPYSLSSGQIFTWEGTSCISDSNGSLLFYSDGITVFTKDHTVMFNGTGLSGGLSSTESCLIISDPGNSNGYYLFTTPDATAGPEPLTYNYIDMNAQVGLGAVVIKNITLIDSSSEKLSAVLHSNGSDIWVIGHSYPGSDYFVHLVSTSGISNPIINNIGSNFTLTNQKAGYLKFSPDGSKLANAYMINALGDSWIELFDFDNSTGILSNPIQIGPFSGLFSGGSGNSAYGIEFSPDNTKLYVSLFYSPILQYDISSNNQTVINNSIDTILYTNNINDTYGCLQNGPDGKIYVAKRFKDSLACIQSPNLLGSSCNIINNYLFLVLGQCVLGLPNYMTSLFNNITNSLSDPLEINSFTIVPNPAHSEIILFIEDNELIPAEIKIFDLKGEIIFDELLNSREAKTQRQINISNLTAGIYCVSIIGKNNTVTKKLIKQ